MTTELERLSERRDPMESPGEIGTVRFLVKCHGNANHVLTLAKSVLQAAIVLTNARCCEESVWKVSLPIEFVKACPQFPTNEELAAYNRLSLEERLANDRKSGWPLRAFMNSFVVNDRYWKWWDAIVIDDNHIALAVEVEEWPFPWESLRWLFRGSGAIDVESS